MSMSVTEKQRAQLDAARLRSNTAYAQKRARDPRLLARAIHTVQVAVELGTLDAAELLTHIAAGTSRNDTEVSA